MLHEPQCCGSDDVSTHGMPGPQFDSVPEHTHAPVVQVAVVGHALLQPPQ
jgi:hypothetical protein